MLYSGCIGVCPKYPQGLMPNEIGYLPLADLRELFAHAEDRRTHLTLGDYGRLFPRHADGSFAGTVTVRTWGIVIQDGRTHGATWHEILSGCSLQLIRDLLAVAVDGRTEAT